MGSPRLIVLLIFALIAASCGDLQPIGPPARSSAAVPGTVADLIHSGALRVAFSASPHGWYSESSSLIQCDADAKSCAGLAPELADELARQLGVRVVDQYYASADQLFNGGRRGEWDVAIVVDDPTQVGIAFAPPLVALDQTYAVRASSSMHSIADVDRPGVRIAVLAGTSIERYLKSALSQATLIPTSGNPLYLLEVGGADAAAGPRGDLLEGLTRLPDGRVLTDSFAQSRWTIAVQAGRPELLAYASQFAANAKSSGFLGHLIDVNGLTGAQVLP